MKRKLALLAGAIAAWLVAVACWIAVGPAVSRTDRSATAIVLGAAVIGTKPSPVYAARIDHAVDLYRQGRVQNILLTGGRSPEDTLTEAASGAAYAMAKGVPETAILQEDRSRTTRENLANAREVLGQARLQPVLIVSDPLHMRRAMAMAASEDFDAQASPTPTTRYRSLATQAPFLAREVWFMHVHWLAAI